MEWIGVKIDWWEFQIIVSSWNEMKENEMKENERKENERKNDKKMMDWDQIFDELNLDR